MEDLKPAALAIGNALWGDVPVADPKPGRFLGEQAPTPPYRYENDGTLILVTEDNELVWRPDHDPRMADILIDVLTETGVAIALDGRQHRWVCKLYPSVERQEPVKGITGLGETWPRALVRATYRLLCETTYAEGAMSARKEST